MSKEEYTGPRVKDTRTFIQKARWVHGDKYDYSKVEYADQKSPVVIICPLHGEFYQKPVYHLSRKCGCSSCRYSVVASRLSWDTNEFIKKAKSVHGSSYSYGRSEYTRSGNKVVITCPAHGDFSQSANSHIQGNGCPKCRADKLSKMFLMDTESFIVRAMQVHNDKYEYGDVVYKNSKHKVIISCPIHGNFLQRPNDHLSGKGCQRCKAEVAGWGVKGFYGTQSPSNLYVLKMGSFFIKVGLAKNINKRMIKLQRESGFSIEKVHSVSGRADELFRIEQEILRNSDLKRHYPSVEFAGQSECIELSELPKVLEIIKNWEKENMDDKK